MMIRKVNPSGRGEGETLKLSGGQLVEGPVEQAAGLELLGVVLRPAVVPDDGDDGAVDGVTGQ